MSRPTWSMATARTRAARLRPYVPGTTRAVLGAGAAAALVWGATTVPGALDLASASGTTAPPVERTSLATSIDAMCPGQELSGIPGADDVEVGGRVAAAEGPDSLLPVPATGNGTAVLTAGDKGLGSMSGRPGSAEADLPADGPVSLTAQGALAPAVTASQEWLAKSDALRGLVTTPCRTASSDLWLLAGGAGAGRQERLTLLNPGGNPVTADVSVHGTGGQVGETRSASVPPGGRTSVLVDAVAGSEKAPAVHVVADGGGLYATLTDTWLDGSTPLGAETVAPADDPSRVQVIPAAVLNGRTTLRVATPADDEAVASVTLLGPDGPVTTTADTVLTVPARGVAELEVPGVPDGTYSVVVRSDTPVVAAAVTQVGAAKGRGDIGWAESSPVLPRVAGTALPDTKGVARTLHLVSTGGASTATVTLVVGGDPQTRTVNLLSERSVDVDLAGASAVWVDRTSGAGALRGGIVSTVGRRDAELLSIVPLDPVAVTSAVSRAFPLP